MLLQVHLIHIACIQIVRERRHLRKYIHICRIRDMELYEIFALGLIQVLGLETFAMFSERH